MRRTIILIGAFLLASACGGGGSETQTEKPEAQSNAPQDRPMENFDSIGGNYTVTTVTNGGMISGRVTYTGAVPERKTLAVTKDMNVCGRDGHLDESLIVSQNKGLANVVVKISNIESGKAPAQGEHVMDQKACTFVPHIALLPAGAQLNIKNSDGILHNFHTFSEINPSVNRGQPGALKTITQTFEKPEIIKVICDVHNWMSGYVVVMDSPYYAITDADGNFEISDVPAGSYTLQFWQETLGKQSKEIAVKAGSTTDASIAFSPGS